MISKRTVVGQKFRWQEESEDRRCGTGVVTAIRTNRQEGLSPEMEDYVALWFEVAGLEGSMVGESFTITLATDKQTYLDGNRVIVALV